MTVGTAPARSRSVRGAHRRDLLLDAAGALVVEQGFSAVSHRAVARRSGLPLAATTYYFATLDELVVQALERVAEGWLHRARALAAEVESAPGDLDEVADAVLRLAALDAAAQRTASGAPGGPAARNAVLGLYERYLEAARRDQLRPVIARYDAALEGVLADVLQRTGLPVAARSAGLVLAVVDGAVLRMLAEGAAWPSARAPVVQLLAVLEGRSRVRPA